MKSIKFFKVKGIGLLELMLSLAIIAILLIMATRYYQSASNSQKVSQAVDEFAAIKGAVQNYHSSQGTTGATAYPTSIAQLVSAGYLPASYLDGAAPSATTSLISNPWNSSIAIAPGATGTETVTMAIPDITSCQQVVNRLAATISSAAGESIDPPAPISGTTACSSVTVTYAVNQ